MNNGDSYRFLMVNNGIMGTATGIMSYWNNGDSYRFLIDIWNNGDSYRFLIDIGDDKVMIPLCQE